MTSTKKAFNKGDLVTHIAEWNKGTVTFRHAIVFSCGKKQMVLTDAVSGREMGREYRPENGTTGAVNLLATTTYERMTDEEATAKGLEHAVALHAHEVEFLERCIARDSSDEYARKDLDKLLGPSAISHTEGLRRLGIDHKNEG